MLIDEQSASPLASTRLITPGRAVPTPLTVAVIIEPAGEPELGEIDTRLGVRVIPVASEA
jgi:hypothetical protein